MAAVSRDEGKTEVRSKRQDNREKFPKGRIILFLTSNFPLLASSSYLLFTY